MNPFDMGSLFDLLFHSLLMAPIFSVLTLESAVAIDLTAIQGFFQVMKFRIIQLDFRGVQIFNDAALCS